MRFVFYVTLISICFVSFCLKLEAQTVGTTFYKDKATEKLFLLSHINSTNVYLLDNCGYIYNEWNTDFLSGHSSYLDTKGNLYRAGKINSDVFKSGGLGGIIEKYNWGGSLLWQYTLATNQIHAHHDFHVLPNDNLLVIAWEFIDNAELLELGRDSSALSPDGFYSEAILEIDPDMDFEVVWEWHAIDHIVQNRDASLPNFCSTGECPYQFDININPRYISNGIDWLHINSIDYNETLDQILLSCCYIDEIVIIDHSTSSRESSSSEGGKAGKGGDLLYRWGNPSNYMLDQTPSQTLFRQHDAKWVNASVTSTPKITVFNNGKGQSQSYSTVEEIELNMLDDYNYLFPDETNPMSDVVWTYNINGSKDLHSRIMSGAQRLPNGNTIICEALKGRIIEVESSGKMLWEYICPIGSGKIFSQGDQPIANTVFNSVSYLFDFFDNSISISNAREKIELDPIECEISQTSHLDSNVSDGVSISILKDQIDLEFQVTNNVFSIIDFSGKVVSAEVVVTNSYSYKTDHLLPGLYILSIRPLDKARKSAYTVKKFLKS